MQCRLVANDCPRTTTREQYKALSRYLRTAARIVRERMEENNAEIEKAAQDMVAFGSGIIFFSGEKCRHIENIYDDITKTYKQREL